MSISYWDLFKRNLGILTNDEQENIRNSKVAVFGCGGGSEIARQLVLSGFENLILADDDIVSIHNLNRQFYFQKNVGKNKAVALAENLKAINPGIKIDVIPHKVTVNTIPELVKKVDIIIDAIPPESALKEEITIAREIRKYDNKYHIYFMDIPWGAKVIAFNKDSQTFEEFMGLKKDCNLNDVDKLTLEDLTKNYLIDASSEMRRVGNLMFENKLSYFPQMAVTVSLAGSMVTTICIFISIGKKIRIAPKVFNVDYFRDFTIK